MTEAQVPATPEALSAQCSNLSAGAGEAIDWVRDVRKHARRLDNEADGLIEQLRRSRNLCRRLGAAAQRPLSVGVFGMSQAGKSYLISTLAQSDSGRLRTDLDDAELDFIEHINPPGGGKEATGLVTRFTRQPSASPKGFPIELTLFSEADVIKVLGNSYFNDFDSERVNSDTSPEHIRRHLAQFEKQRQPAPTGGLDEDDMVDLLDYFQGRYAKSMKPLLADFWPTVIELAPRLSADARGRLLSVLWGEENTALTEVYVKMRNALATLGNARTVFVPLSALVKPSAGGYEWSADSILNVDVLDRLGRDDAEPLRVLPVGAEGEIGAETGIARSLLAALTAEMKFVLADPPVASMLESVDLLDFPGYRGRLAIANLDDIRKDPRMADSDPVAQLLLRGKVGYLFERYTDDQEMNVLIMCTRCDIQIEITALEPVLSSWVKSTQGTSPEERAARPAGLIWVITQLDKRLMPVPGQSDAAVNQLWGSMIHITLLERFGQCEWVQEWADGACFDNVFLMRKPGFMSAVIETEERASGETIEGALKPGEGERLDRLRDLFAKNENVARHVRDPEAAWAAVLAPNDGGMGRLAAYLATVSAREIKLNRIAEQVSKTKAALEKRFEDYFFAEGAGEVEKKTQAAAAVSAAVEEHADAFGEMVFALQPPSEHLRRLYLSADAAPASDGAEGSEPAEAPAKRSTLVRLSSVRKDTAATAPVKAPAMGRAGLFAQAVLREWIKQLRALPGDAGMLRFLGLPPAVLQAVTDELVTASDRCRLEERLVATLRPLEDKRSTTRAGIVDQQVLLARNVVNDFVDFAGAGDVPLDERPASPVDGRKIFEPPAPIPVGTLPILPEEEIPYSAMYVLDWLEAFRAMAIGNAGHSAGREISPEQNQWLGKVLARMRGEARVEATG